MTVLQELSSPSEDDTPATPMLGAPIDGPGAWKVADFKSPADYTIELSAANLRDIEQAIRQIKAAGLGLDDLQREHFELSSLRPVIAEIRHQIEVGRGFVVLRRLPVEDYSKDELGMIFWGLGTHLGRGLSQSVLGDRLGHVKDFSREDPLARAYRNKQELSPHTDSVIWSGWRACAMRDGRRIAPHQRPHGSQCDAGGVSGMPRAPVPRLCLSPARRGAAGRASLHALSGAGLFQHRGEGVGALRAHLCRGRRGGGRPTVRRRRARGSRLLRGDLPAAGADAGIHAAPGRGVFHQQLHDPACALRVR